MGGTVEMPAKTCGVIKIEGDDVVEIAGWVSQQVRATRGPVGLNPL